MKKFGIPLIVVLVIALVFYLRFRTKHESVSSISPPPAVAVGEKEKKVEEVKIPAPPAQRQDPRGAKYGYYSLGEILIEAGHKSAPIRIPNNTFGLPLVNAVLEPEGYDMTKDFHVVKINGGKISDPIPGGTACGNADFIEIYAGKKMLVEVLIFDEREKRDAYANLQFAESLKKGGK